MTSVYIVWAYDDGILDVYSSLEKAESKRNWYHEQQYYHEEDTMIKKMEIDD